MALTDVGIRNAKSGAKAIKLADGGGMFLLITPARGKLSRLKYRVDGREKLLAIGAYPEIGLGEARRRRDGAKGWAPTTAPRSEYLLSLVCGSIGKLPIAEIESADVLTAIRRIEGKGKLESARRSLQLAGAVSRFIQLWLAPAHERARQRL